MGLRHWGATAFAALLASCGQDEPSSSATSHPAMHPMPAIYAGVPEKPGAPIFEGLGDHHHAVTTASPEAQAYFDQGIRLLFGFNHAEAIRSFREAARRDPDCAMCWWGVAFALGPNINLPMPDDANAPALEALAKARAAAAKASPREQAYIEALSARYSDDASATRAELDAAFADAMARLAQAYPDDLDARTFYAEAMMDTQPWDYWQPDRVTPKGRGADIIATLEAIIARAPNHPGALHLYIHAVEASTTPERAEAAADRLATLMPGQGHIVHMPSHIYYRVGRYADARRANEIAALADEAYIAACKAQGFYPAAYYVHNIHFLWTSSEMEGRYAAALDAARRIVAATDIELARQLAVVQLYLFTPVVTHLRFAKWDAVLAEPAPDADLKVVRAMWHYAQAFARANTGDLDGARAARAELDTIVTAGEAEGLAAEGVPIGGMLAVARHLVDGELARKAGDLESAIASFRAAQIEERALPYMEPPYWHQPVSHILGAALVEAGRAGEAEAVYRDSLADAYRRDGWALFGLAQALEAQGRADEAAAARADFAAAWADADTTLAASRL